jgi:hypothetical protein
MKWCWILSKALSVSVEISCEYHPDSIYMSTFFLWYVLSVLLSEKPSPPTRQILPFQEAHFLSLSYWYKLPWSIVSKVSPQLPLGGVPFGYNIVWRRVGCGKVGWALYSEPHGEVHGGSGHENEVLEVSTLVWAAALTLTAFSSLRFPSPFPFPSRPSSLCIGDQTQSLTILTLLIIQLDNYWNSPDPKHHICPTHTLTHTHTHTHTHTYTHPSPGWQYSQRSILSWGWQSPSSWRELLSTSWNLLSNSGLSSLLWIRSISISEPYEDLGKLWNYQEPSYNLRIHFPPHFLPHLFLERKIFGFISPEI